MKSLEIPALIFEVWRADHIALRRSKGYKYALVLIDSLSVFCILLSAKTAGAEETANLLYHNLFMLFGARVFLTDRGSAFRSKLVKALCSLLGTTQVFTLFRHPQTNSRAESFNKNILNSLRTTCNLEQNWPDLLFLIAFSFRTAVVKSIGISPFEIVFGVKH